MESGSKLRLDRPPLQYLPQVLALVAKIFVITNPTNLIQELHIVRGQPVFLVIQTLGTDQNALRYFHGSLLA